MKGFPLRGHERKSRLRARPIDPTIDTRGDWYRIHGCCRWSDHFLGAFAEQDGKGVIDTRNFKECLVREMRCEGGVEGVTRFESLGAEFLAVELQVRLFAPANCGGDV